MKIITERDKIKSVPKRWNKQYGVGNHSNDKIVIMNKLNNLDLNTATAKQIDNIIGNKTWTNDTCSECGKYSSPVVMIGQKPDYGSCTVWICVDCLKRIFKLTKHLLDK